MISKITFKGQLSVGGCTKRKRPFVRDIRRVYGKTGRFVALVPALSTHRSSCQRVHQGGTLEQSKRLASNYLAKLLPSSGIPFSIALLFQTFGRAQEQFYSCSVPFHGTCGCAGLN